MKKTVFRTAASSFLAMPALVAGFAFADPASASFVVVLTFAAAKALLVVDYFVDKG